MKKFIFAFYFLSFALLLSACVSIPSSNVNTEQTQPKEYSAEIGRYGGELIGAVSGDPKSFNPILAKETSTTAVTGMLFEGLTRTNGITTEVEPNLAEKWEVTADGLSWTFYLRKDVKWFDGKILTADDIVFTFNDLIYNKDIPNSARDIFTIDEKIFKIEKIGDFVVRFILPTKFAPFLRSMSQEILPKHILEESVKKGKFNETWTIDTDVKKIIGTGPYILEKYVPGERIIFVKNKNYWKKDKEGNFLPYIEKIIYQIVQNEDVEMLKFEKGEIDYYGLRGTDYPILKPKEKTNNFTVYETGPTFASNFLFFNLNPNAPIKKYKIKWFSDLNFRKAVAHAIDKKNMVDIVLNGLGSPQKSSMSPSAGFFYNGNVSAYEYDLEKSKNILEGAGYKDTNNDGIREDSEGNKLEIVLITNADNTVREKLGGIIRKDLEQIGIKTYFNPIEFNTLVSKLSENYDFEAVLIGLTGGIEPHFGSNVWLSSGHLHMWNPLQKTPETDWEARVDEIFKLGVQELDENKRKILYDEWQNIVSEKLPLIYTVLPENIIAVRNKFGNLYPTSYGGAFWNLEELYVK